MPVLFYMIVINAESSSEQLPANPSTGISKFKRNWSQTPEQWAVACSCLLPYSMDTQMVVWGPYQECLLVHLSLISVISGKI